MADAQTATNLVLALGPAFATGFALQRALDILDDPIAALIGRGGASASSQEVIRWKKYATSGISLGAGLLVAIFGGMHVLGPLGFYSGNPSAGIWWLDVAVTGLIISAGTEGFNSIMKFLGYSKENAKNSDGNGQETKVAAIT